MWTVINTLTPVVSVVAINVSALDGEKTGGWKTWKKENTWKTGLDGMVILKCILKKLDGLVWTGFV
jgi:hypothetical protein